MDHSDEKLIAYLRRQGEQCNSQQPIVPVAGSELLKAADRLAALSRPSLEPSDALLKAAIELRDDLLLRGEVEEDGITTVNVSQGRWMRFNDAIAALQHGEGSTTAIQEGTNNGK